MTAPQQKKEKWKSKKKRRNPCCHAFFSCSTSASFPFFPPFSFKKVLPTPLFLTVHAVSSTNKKEKIWKKEEDTVITSSVTLPKSLKQRIRASAVPCCRYNLLYFRLHTLPSWFYYLSLISFIALENSGFSTLCSIIRYRLITQSRFCYLHPFAPFNSFWYPFVSVAGIYISLMMGW